MALRNRVLSPFDPRTVLRQTYEQVRKDDVTTYAASLAYYSFLALFPFLLFLFALVTFFGQPQLLDRLLDWAGTVVPPQAMRQVTTVLQDSFENGNAGLLSLGAAGAIWAASGGIRSAMTVLTRAYHEADARPWWRRYLLSLAYTLGLGVLVLLAAAIMLLGPRPLGWLLERIGVGASSLAWWEWTRYPVAITLLVLGTGVAYSVLPNVPGFRWISPGAVVAVVLWIGLSLGFRLYLANFGRYNVLYGAVGAVIVLLLYLWLCSLVLLVGGELNSVLLRAEDERSGEGAGA